MTPVLVEEDKGSQHQAPGCRLGLYEDVNEAWSCLRGKHLVFVGDSVMRFQYINMVQALEHGQWDQCRERPSNAWSRHWGGPRGTWNEFFRGVNERLRGHEVCDCQRAGPNFKDAEQVENRYYYNPQHDIRVSFFLWYGMHEHLPQGHDDLQNKPLETITQESLGCEPGECGAPSDWKFGKIHDFLRSPLMVSNVRPDILILNTGLHGPVKNPSVIEGIVSAAQQAVSETNGQVYWKTTTTRSRLADTYDDSVARQVFLQSGLRVLDEGAQTVPIRDWPEGPPLLFYHDKTHYKDTIYSGLNQLALHAICLP